jgi:hypothetical protein
VTPSDFSDVPVPDGRASTATTGELTAWVARLAADDAARQRARGAWLHRQAAEEGTFAGVLADLAERGRPVVVALHNGRRHRGVVAALGRDFVIVVTGDQREVLVRSDAIASVHTLPGEPETIGDRVVVSQATLGDALGVLGEERPRLLLLGLDGHAGVRGELRAVGADVVTVRQDGGATAYLSLSAVAEVSLTESG